MGLDSAARDRQRFGPVGGWSRHRWAAPSQTRNALERQVSQGGGTIIEADGTVGVNNEQAVAAFERARGWGGTSPPHGVTTSEEPGRLNVFATGNALSLRNTTLREVFVVDFVLLAQPWLLGTALLFAGGRLPWSKSDRPAGELPTELAKPARQALIAAGYTRLEHLVQASEVEILDLHGMCPKALGQLQCALSANDLTFAEPS